MAIVFSEQSEEQKSQSGLQGFLKNNFWPLVISVLIVFFVSTALAVSYQKEANAFEKWNDLKKKWYMHASQEKSLDALNEALFPIAASNPQLAQELKPSLVSWALAKGKNKQALKLLNAKPSASFFPKNSSLDKDMLDQFNHLSKSGLEIEATLAGKKDAKSKQREFLTTGHQFLTTFSFSGENSEKQSASTQPELVQYLYMHQLMRQLVLASSWGFYEEKQQAIEHLLSLLKLDSHPSSAKALQKSIEESTAVASALDHQLNERALLLTAKERESARKEFCTFLYDKVFS